jgi:hypothetical protein
VTDELLSIERVNGLVVSRTFAVQLAPPLVVADGRRSGEPGTAAREPNVQVAAGEAYGDLAVAVGRGGNGHRARS